MIAASVVLAHVQHGAQNCLARLALGAPGWCLIVIILDGGVGVLRTGVSVGVLGTR